MTFFEIVQMRLFIIGNMVFPTAGEDVDPLSGQGRRMAWCFIPEAFLRW